MPKKTAFVKNIQDLKFFARRGRLEPDIGLEEGLKDQIKSNPELLQQFPLNVRLDIAKDIGKDFYQQHRQFYLKNPQAAGPLTNAQKVELEQHFEPTAMEKFITGTPERRETIDKPLSPYQQELQGVLQPQLMQLLPEFLQQLSPAYQQQQQALQRLQYMQSPLTQQMINPQAQPLFPDQQQQQFAQQPMGGIDFGALTQLLMPYAQQFAQSPRGQQFGNYVTQQAQDLGGRLMGGLNRLLGRGQ